uniref:Uncharacterized protein n=1 Tax=Pristionchus pacificus TaxID=54126 RepID=A0A2A6CYW5_PRIPA|eukprot:PDM83296.1 hypothetical protein PRIPAC_34928 [Pristionchus pacificus]
MHVNPVAFLNPPVSTGAHLETGRRSRVAAEKEGAGDCNGGIYCPIFYQGSNCQRGREEQERNHESPPPSMPEWWLEVIDGRSRGTNHLADLRWIDDQFALGRRSDLDTMSGQVDLCRVASSQFLRQFLGGCGTRALQNVIPLSKFQQDTNLLLPTVSVLTGTPGGGGGGGAIDAPGADPGGGGGGGGGGAPAKGWRSKIRWSSGIKDQRSNVPVVVVVEGAVLLLREWIITSVKVISIIQ